MATEKGSVTETDKYVFFWSGWPSQWHPSKFEVDGIVYTCAEQMMMAEKARLFKDEKTLQKILESTKPAQQKSLGRKVKGFTEEKWLEHREDIVTRVSYYKYKNNAKLKKKLLDTGDKILVEASPKDAIWGIGIAVDRALVTPPEKWTGLNLLGKSLMSARQRIREEEGKDGKTQIEPSDATSEENDTEQSLSTSSSSSSSSSSTTSELEATKKRKKQKKAQG